MDAIVCKCVTCESCGGCGLIQLNDQDKICEECYGGDISEVCERCQMLD